jgi:uncharacterized membrane protein YhaH (DUF805 family)
MATPRGAGRSGGWLFLLVMLFVGYLAITALAGILRLLIGAAIVVVAVVFLTNVMSRR